MQKKKNGKEQRKKHKLCLKWQAGLIRNFTEKRTYFYG